jgi:hypothetical protein
MRRARIKKADIRIAQGNPTWRIRRLSMIGKMIPPVLEPVEATPNASALFFSNHWRTELIATSVLVLHFLSMKDDFTWLEQSWGADGAQNALGEEDLVVLRRKRCHHQAKDVQYRASEDQVPRTITIMQLPYNDTLQKSTPSTHRPNITQDQPTDPITKNIWREGIHAIALVE